ncbi:MAG TPA: homoserine kinase [Gemmatimonadales bacterium]|nr:homoserine kinase [Gemmatimonadales bacterium]
MSGPAAVTAFAPASVGNVGPGLDIVGLAVEGPGDEVRAEWTDGRGVRILEAGHPELPADAERHASGLAALAVLRRAGVTPERGIGLRVRKGLPLAGGQGGSAASAVAGAVATNALLGSPLEREALIEACLDAEEAVAGRHADNVAPALLGGIVLLRAVDPLDLVQLPVPSELFVVLVRPDQRMRTADARAVLPRDVPRAVALHQAAQVAAMVAALAAGDYELLGRAIDDRIAEPARAGLLPGFVEAKAAALEAGALGSSISGSGPTAFALARGRERAERVAAAMVASHAAGGRRAESVVGAVDRRGARLTDDPSRRA